MTGFYNMEELKEFTNQNKGMQQLVFSFAECSALPQRDCLISDFHNTSEFALKNFYKTIRISIENDTPMEAQ